MCCHLCSHPPRPSTLLNPARRLRNQQAYQILFLKDLARQRRETYADEADETSSNSSREEELVGSGVGGGGFCVERNSEDGEGEEGAGKVADGEGGSLDSVKVDLEGRFQGVAGGGRGGGQGARMRGAYGAVVDEGDEELSFCLEELGVGWSDEDEAEQRREMEEDEVETQEEEDIEEESGGRGEGGGGGEEEVGDEEVLQRRR